MPEPQHRWQQRKIHLGTPGLGHCRSEAAAASLRPLPPGGARAPRRAPARHGGAERLRPPRWRGLRAPLSRAATSRFRRAARSSSVGNKNHLRCWWVVGKWDRRLAGNQVPPPDLFVVFRRVVLGVLLGCAAGGRPSATPASLLAPGLTRCQELGLLGTVSVVMTSSFVCTFLNQKDFSKNSITD